MSTTSLTITVLYMPPLTPLLYCTLSPLRRLAQVTSATPPIVISGQFLYNSATGEQFSCRGIGFSLETSASPSPNSKDFFLDSEEVCSDDRMMRSLGSCWVF